MRYQVLGEIRVIAADGVAVGVGGPRQQRLLVSLLLAGSAGRRVDELIEHMWDADSEDLPDDPAASVRTYVGRLRSVVGTETIIAEQGNYRLERAAEDLDAVQFGLLSEEAANCPEPAGRVEVFNTMLGLWQGPPFGEIGGTFWLTADEARLTEIRAAAVEARLDALLDSGRVAEVIAGARSELEQEPFREGLRRLEMLALYRAGRQADALEAFQQHRRRLVEELGVEASPELRRLERLILEQDPSLENVGNAGRPLRGYRVHNVIGEGAFSIVHRATQPAVNRDVAIKVIRAELANQPEFIRRFEAEAQLVARLEHPHIVPLYDFWREPDRAYLVMRYLPHGSLATRLLSGPLSSADTYRIVEQLAEALEIAHGAGIAHRDIKPANVLLDAQGNAYLSDFGIAQGIDDDEPGGGFLSPGSPAYAAPEQVTQAVATTASDIYSLGVMVYEMLTAELPWPEATDRASLLRHQLEDPLPSIAEVVALTSGIDEVISKATAKAPGLRFSSAPALADALREALDLSEVPATARFRRQGSGVGSVTAVTGGDNPFVGLEAFDEADADRFFGRERIVEDLITRLSSDRIAIVLGASGSGKSSVVRAGLVPAVRRGDIAGSDQWYVATMRVGGDPYSRLRDALSGIAVSSAQVPTIEELRTERGIAAAMRGLLVPAGGGEPSVLLLVLDQLEELFSQAEETEANRFLDGLADALGDSAVPLRVVGTLRADYLDRPLSHAAFGQLIRGATVTVPPMTPAELERAITAPVAIAGGSVEAGLVAQMVADTANLPSMLPLLQFALTELFELGDGRLTVANYDGLGGTTGALVDRADQVYESFDEEEQAIARALFGRLTNVAKTPLTARRVPRGSLDDLGERVDHVVDTLGGARLLSFGHDSRTREPTVEVAHEALLRSWPRLVEWLDSERTSVETVGRVRTATDEWIHDDRDEGALLRGVALDAASQLVGTGWLGSDEGQFIAASVAAHDREETEQRAQLVREQRTSRRLRRLLAGVAALTVIALVAGGIAFQQQRRADESADEAAAAAEQAEENAAQADENAEQALAAQERAEHEALISRAVSESATRPTLGLLLAVEASLRNEGDASDRALLSALNTGGGRVSVIEETRFENVSPIPCLEVFGSSVYMIDFEAFAPRQETTTHSVVDLATGEVNQFEAPSGNCFPAVSPDGSTVLLRHWDPDAEVVAAEAWDLETGSMIWSSEPGHAVAGWLSDDVVLLRPTGDDINENITD
ncbi:MAG: protein kinase, partial [Acidimicrobiia bacterium]|nr:protein kinase [Acidimicrobiia bacterium]